MQLKKNEANQRIALTLTERTTISNPNYLFEFINNQTKQVYTCICGEVSATSKYNLFDITEGVDDRTNSSLILGLAGQYYYNIHQQSSSTNLDPDLAQGIVERGYMVLEGVVDEIRWVSNEINITYVAHEQ